jgi:PAS domain S-box-containing protein
MEALGAVMPRSTRDVSRFVGVETLLGLGALYSTLAIGWAIHHLIAGAPGTETLIEVLLIGGPGVALLYGGYQLPDTELHPDVYPQIAVWTLGGLSVMLGVLALVELNPGGGLDRPVFSTSLATALGSVAGFAIGRDKARAVSRAKKVAEQRDRLRQERDLRDRIVQTSPVGIVIINPDRSIRMVNERAVQISGYSKSELERLESANHSMFEATDADGNSVEGGIFEQILTTNEPVYDVERQITHADGHRVWLSVSGAPLMDSSGDVSAIIVGYRDITERKEYEQRLEASNERLEHFAHATSHDLQEPIRMVSSYVQLLEQRYGDELDEEASEYIDFAVDGAERMRAMVQSLLEYSRVSTQGDSFEPVDANQILEGVLESLKVRIEETDASIESDDLPAVTADADQLRQVFQNLLKNALKYSGETPPRIRVSAERRGDEWQFAVADEGPGIDPDYHDRIFDVFESAHTDTEEAGSGIGLALCERIIERHGGEIWVDSEPGEGATFYFTLATPAEDPAPQATTGVETLPR